MNQFDPNITGLLEGDVTSVAVIDPQPFIGGVGNHVIDPNEEFTLTIEWQVFGQLVPLWLAAVGGNWDVSVYAESLGGGSERRLGTQLVSVNNFVACATGVNCRKYSATVTVPANTLDPHVPNTDQGGLYKLATAVFLNSTIAGIPGYDLVGFREGPIIQAEPPE